MSNVTYESLKAEFEAKLAALASNCKHQEIVYDVGACARAAIKRATKDEQ
jgi:hypothetical protein